MCKLDGRTSVKNKWFQPEWVDVNPSQWGKLQHDGVQRGMYRRFKSSLLFARHCDKCNLIENSYYQTSAFRQGGHGEEESDRSQVLFLWKIVKQDGTDRKKNGIKRAMYFHT